MEVERKHSKGGFFHLFDWNGKSQKKLFPNSAEISEESKRVKPVENILKSPPYMMKGDEYNAASSCRRSADFSSASSVASDEGYGSRAPGVVARLMGLDSLPAPNVLEPSSTTYSGSCSLRVSHYERSSPNLWNESQPMDYTDFSNKLDSLSSNPIEPRFHKVQNRPIERFQTEILPLKSAKPIPITQHKLLSPIKSPGFIPTKNAAYIMEAASKIIEVSPQKTSKHKVPSFGLSSVPLQIWDLKDKIEAAHKVSGHQRPDEPKVSGHQRPDEPIRSTEMSLKGQHKSKSHNKSDYAPTFSISRDSEKGSSNNSRNKGKSVSLAEQARVNNVQRKEGSFSSGNGSSANLKEGNDAKRKQFCRSQADMRKIMENGTSANRTNKVLRQNNQKQNCISNRDYSIPKTSTLDQQGRKTRSINGTVGLNRTINKVIVNSESQSRKTSSSETDPSKEVSMSRRKNLPRKKQPVNEDVLSGEPISENTSIKSTQRSIKCNVTTEEHSNQSAEKMKTSMDVVSFTFTSPIARFVPDVPSTSQVVETSCSFDNDPCGNNDLVFSKSSGFSSLGLNIIGGDDLSVLLGKKLQELAYRVESSNCNIIMEETSSRPTSSWQNSVLPSGTLIPTSMRHHKGLQLDLDKDISYSTADFNCSSIDHLELDWRSKWQFSEEIEDRNASKSSSKTGTELDLQQSSPLSTLELAVTSECFADDRDGMKQELLDRNQELLGSQPGSESETEFDVALSDFASPKTVGEMDKKLPTRTPNSRDLKESTNWELDYVKMVLKDSELKLMEYALGQTENILTLNGFDQLEHRNITETQGKLVVDCVSEYLEFVVGSCKGWGKLMQNKGRLAEEVYKEIMSLKQMGDIMVDEVVDKDMSRKHGRWAHEDEEQGEVFFDESDIIDEIDVDEEDLPDAEDDIVEDSDDSIHIFTGHTGELYAVACNPTDPVLVATGGGDDKGFLWKIGHADWASELQGHTDSVSSLAFSHDGQLLASGGFDGLVKVWDTSGNLKSTLEGPGGGIEWIRWHPKGHLILAGSEDCTVWMWNADNGSCLNVFSGHGASVTCGDFTPDGKTICTGSEDATLRIWNPRSGESIHVVRGYPYHTEGLTCLSISSDSTFAVTGSKDGSVHVVKITTGKVASSWASQTSSTEGDPESIECVSFAPKFPWAVSGGMDRNLTIWDLQNSSPRFICNHEEGVTCLAWLGASKFLATGCCDGRICIWNCLSGECVITFKGHEHAIQSLSVSSNLEFLVSVSMDSTARVFEIRNFH